MLIRGFVAAHGGPSQCGRRTGLRRARPISGECRHPYGRLGEPWSGGGHQDIRG